MNCLGVTIAAHHEAVITSAGLTGICTYLKSHRAHHTIHHRLLGFAPLRNKSLWLFLKLYWL